MFGGKRLSKKATRGIVWGSAIAGGICAILGAVFGGQSEQDMIEDAVSAEVSKQLGASSETTAEEPAEG